MKYILQDITRLQDFTRFFKVLQDFTRFYKVLQDFTRFCKILQDFTRFYKILQGFTAVGYFPYNIKSLQIISLQHNIPTDNFPTFFCPYR